MKNCGCADGANLKLGRCGARDSAGSAVFVKVEKIGVTGGASHRPYGNWVVYVAFAVMAEMEMLAVDKKDSTK